MRKLAKFLNTILICVSILTCSIPVEAASDFSLKKIVDMALTKTGIVANDTYLNRMADSMQNMLNRTAQSYYSYCTLNSLPFNSDSWNQYLASDSYAGIGFVLPNWVLRSNYWLDFITKGVSNLSQQEVAKIILDVYELKNDSNYTIPSDAVYYIRNEFNSIANEDYFYVRVRPYSELLTTWHKSAESFYNLQRVVSQSPHGLPIIVDGDALFFVSDDVGYNYVDDGNSVRRYNDNWELVPFKSIRETINQADFEFLTYQDFSHYLANADISNYYETYADYLADHGVFNGNKHRLIFYGPVETKKIIYTSVVAMRDYSAGNKPYFLNTNYVYDSSQDNSVNFSGSYYNNNSSNYSYDIIQKEILNNNSTTDNSVQNIVNNYSQTIINNYTGTGTGDGSGGSSGGTGSIGDGIQSFFDGLLALLDFILELLGKVVEAVSTLLSGVLSLLTTLTDSFSGFTGLLGGMFSFLPQEVMDILSLGITAIVTIGIIKAIKG